MDNIKDLQNMFKGIDVNSIAKVSDISYVSKSMSNALEPSRELQRVIDEGNRHKARVDQAIIDTSETNKQIFEQTQETNRQLEVANESLQRANKGLEKINDSLENQLESVNTTIDFILKSIGANAKRDEQLEKETQKMLAEIQVLLATKDEKGLKQFFEEHTGDIASIMGTVLTGISMFIK